MITSLASKPVSHRSKVDPENDQRKRRMTKLIRKTAKVRGALMPLGSYDMITS
jgi:hypothetical protein